MGVGNLGHFGLGHALGEAGDGVVAAVHLHQQRGARGDGFSVVFGVGAVGGAHLDQLGTGAAHDVGDAEGAANFHQLAARDDDFLARCQRVEREQHGGGVVVDHGGGFRAGQLAQQVGDEVVAVAAPAGGQVKFQIRWRGERLHHRLHGGIGQQGAAQVGVQHRAGEVEHGLQAWRKACCQVLLCLCGQGLGCKLRGSGLARQRGGAQRVQRGAHGGGGGGCAVFGRQGARERGGEHAVHAGQAGRGVHGAGLSSASAMGSSGFMLARANGVSPMSRSSSSVARSSARGSASGSFSWLAILR